LTQPIQHSNSRSLVFPSLHGVFRLWYLQGMVWCMIGLMLGGACSRGIVQEAPPLQRQWECDKEADEAMKQRNYGRALLLHHRFLEKEPANGRALYHLGYAYGQTGDHRNEAAYYEKAIKLGFMEEAIFFNLGMAYGELNQMEQSIGAFKKAVSLHPHSADSHFGLALAYHRAALDTLAEEEFLDALKLDPTHVDARLYLSVLYADQGVLQKACEHLQMILDIDPSNRRARQFLRRIERE